MARFLRLLRPDWLTLLSGALIILAFPPYGISPLIWICLVPWFFALHRAADSGRAAIQGVWLSWIMCVGGFPWMAFVLHEYGSVPWPISVAMLVLYGIGGELQFPAYAIVFKRTLPHDPSLRPAPTAYQGSALRVLGLSLWLAISYAGIDWFLPKLWTDTLGHSLYTARDLRQIADLGGAFLITFLVVLANDTIFRLCYRWLKRGEPSLRPALAASGPELATLALLVVAAMAYGHTRREFILSKEANPRATVNLGVIQGNIGDFEKIAAEEGLRGANEKVLTDFFTLSDQALAMDPKPAALIWPETAYPGTFRTPESADDLGRDERVENFVRTRGVPLYFGGYDHFGRKDFNALFFLSPRQPVAGGESDLQIYRKNMLLLFGEYIPGAETFKFIADAFPEVGNFGRGPGPVVLNVPTADPKVHSIAVGPIICYEALFPSYVLAAARRGSELILNITNDSWFGPFGEPVLHLALTTFRSIETRLPQLRSTNTGISALILPDGEIAQATPVGKATVLNAQVPLLEPIPTVMKKFGDWFGPTSLIFFILGCFGGLVLKVPLGSLKRPVSNPVSRSR